MCHTRRVCVQTLTLCPQVTLCDCPGLVFPSFVTSSAEMVLNGILPIAHLRDHVGAHAASDVTIPVPSSSPSPLCVFVCVCRPHEAGV